MSLALLTSREAVLAAIREFDEIGRDAFLAKYRFGPARGFLVEHDGRLYDSKALVGAAVGSEPRTRSAAVDRVRRDRKAGDGGVPRMFAHGPTPRLGRRSHSCVRLDNAAVRLLNVRIVPGTPVTIPLSTRGLRLLNQRRRPSSGAWPRGSQSAGGRAGGRMPSETSLRPRPENHAVEREEQRREDDA
jgi:hypothetical protein